MWGAVTVDMVLGALDNRARGSVARHTAMIPKAGWNHLQSFVFFLFSHFLITKNASSASPFCHYKNPLSVHLEDRTETGEDLRLRGGLLKLIKTFIAFKLRYEFSKKNSHEIGD